MVNNETIGKVIIGDSDSLIFLGGEAQGKLRDYSKSLATITLRDNDQIELLVEEIICEMDKLPSLQDRYYLSGLFNKRSFNQSRIIAKYDHLLTYIDQVTIALQLQEAQLLKDNALLKNMKVFLSETSQELEQCLSTGREFLGKPLICHEEDSATISLQDSTYDAIWGERLDKRLEDLAVSHTLALQMLAQIDLMRNSNSQLIDRLSSALSGTIPLWMNQITLILGVEKRFRVQSVQRKLEHISTILRNGKAGVLPKTGQENCTMPTHNSNELDNANHSLQASFRSLVEIEQNDRFVRHEMSKILDKE